MNFVPWKTHQGPIRVIQTIASTRIDHGGTSRSVPATCDALAALGIDCHLLTAIPADRSVSCNFPRDRSRVHTAVESAIVRQSGIPQQFDRRLTGLHGTANGPTVLHDHGVWLRSNHAVARFARRHNVSRIVSPRGMLGQWALGLGRWKKRLAWRLYQQSDLQQATAFHATAEQEADEIRALGLRQPIAVIPNGVQIPATMPVRRKMTGRLALFMSRIHPKKGLINLVRAWKAADIDRHWRLALVGPDEKGHQSEVEREVRRLGLEDRVTFRGPVSDTNKWQLLVDSDLFILPSFSENFGIVVAEAFVAGLPVVTTTGTPWSQIEDRNVGWYVTPNVGALAQAIGAATSADPRILGAMGRRGADWARSEFTWTATAQKMSAFYNWLQLDARRPTFVVD